MVSDLSGFSDKGKNLPISNTFYWACEINLTTGDIYWIEYENSSKRFRPTDHFFPDDIPFNNEQLTSTESARDFLAANLTATLQDVVHIEGTTTNAVIYLSEKPTEGQPELILSDVVGKTNKALLQNRSLQGSIKVTGIFTSNEMTTSQLNKAIDSGFSKMGRSR